MKVVYSDIYYVRQYGLVATGPLTGQTVEDAQMDLHCESEADAKQWCEERQKKFFPTGRVELWARKWEGGKRGKFVHRKISD